MDSIILSYPDALFNRRHVSINLLYSNIIVFEKNQIIRSIDLSNVLGAKYKQNSKGFHYLELYLYEFSKEYNWIGCFSQSNKLRSLQKLSFYFESNKDQCQNWVNAINNLLVTGSIVLINGKHATPLFKNYLVFVSPKSGKGKALKLFETIIKPMFEEASGQIQVVVTSRSNQAYDHVKAYDLSGLSAIVTIGGDGMLYEVVNGLCSSKKGMQRLKTLPVIPLPAGTGNGFSKSLLHESNHDYSLVNATFAAIRGHPKPFDLSRYETLGLSGNVKSHYSFLSWSYGLIADVDIHTESMRWLGETRLFLGAIYYSIKKRLYKGKLSILTNDSCEGQQPSSHNSSVVSDSSAPLLSTSSPMHPTPINNSNDTDNLPPITEPIDTSAYGWEVIEEAFTMIWVLQTSHAGATVHSSPTSRLADGVFTVLYTTNCSTIDLLKLLVLIDNGQHIHHPALKKRTCVAFRFEPKDLNDNGIFSLDGEFVEYGTIQGTVLPKAALTLGL